MSSFFDPKLGPLVPYVPGEQPRGIENLIKLNTNEGLFSQSGSNGGLKRRRDT
jgi:hypothetical protein